MTAEVKVIRGSTPWLTSYPRVQGGDYRSDDDGGFAQGMPDNDSGQVRIYTPTSTPAEDDWQSATVDGLEDVLAEAAAEGATALETEEEHEWTRGALYRVKTEGGALLTVESARTVTGTTLYLTEPITTAVAAGDDITGLFVTAQLTADQTERVGEGHAVWRIEIGGIEFVWSQLFRIVERLPGSTLTPVSLTKAFPDIRHLRTQEDLDLEELIAAAWQHEVLTLLHSWGIPEENVVSREALEPLHAIACFMFAMRPLAEVPAELYERMDKQYEKVKRNFRERADLWTVKQTPLPPPREMGKEASRRRGLRIRR